MKLLIGLAVVGGVITAPGPAAAAQTLDQPGKAPMAELREQAAQIRTLARMVAAEQLEALENLGEIAQRALSDPRLQQRLQELQERLQQQAQQLQRDPQPPRPARPVRPLRPVRPERDDRARGPETTENFSRTVRLGRNGTFDLSNVAGDVVVTGGGGDDVRIEAVKRVRGGNGDEARSLLRELEIQVNERSGLVEVRTELPRRRNTSGSAVDFTIALPSGANVAVKTVSGDVRISNVKGDLRAESISGDVTLTGVDRLRAAKSVSGDIEIDDAGGEDLNASTVSGDVIVRKLRTRGVDLESVSGNLRFSDAEAERVNLRSISGDIDYEGRLARSGRYDMQSHSGNIRIMPTGNPGFDIEASTFSGDVRSDFQLTTRSAPGNSLTGRDRPRLNRTVRGAFGDASSILSLRSFSGNITVVRR